MIFFEYLNPQIVTQLFISCFYKVIAIYSDTEGKLIRLVSLRESTEIFCLLKVFFKGDTSFTQFCIICWLQAKFLFTSFQWNSTLFRVLFTSIAICLVVWNLSMSFVIGKLSIRFFFFSCHMEKKKQVNSLVTKYNFFRVNFKIGKSMTYLKFQYLF